MTCLFRSNAERAERAEGHLASDLESSIWFGAKAARRAIGGVKQHTQLKKRDAVGRFPSARFARSALDRKRGSWR
jgi:hypothetical protein